MSNTSNSTIDLRWYNLTAWNSDTPHLSRTIVDVSLGGIITIALAVLFPLTMLRMRLFPLRSHGYLFQILKFVCNLYISLFFVVFMFLNRLWISLLIILIPLAALYPTIQRLVGVVYCE